MNVKGFIAVADVREKASILVDTSFSKYKKFERLGERIKGLLDLKSEGRKGQQKKWVPIWANWNKGCETSKLTKQVFVNTTKLKSL